MPVRSVWKKPYSFIFSQVFVLLTVQEKKRPERNMWSAFKTNQAFANHWLFNITVYPKNLRQLYSGHSDNHSLLLYILT